GRCISSAVPRGGWRPGFPAQAPQRSTSTWRSARTFARRPGRAARPADRPCNSRATVPGPPPSPDKVKATIAYQVLLPNPSAEVKGCREPGMLPVHPQRPCRWDKPGGPPALRPVKIIQLAGLCFTSRDENEFRPDGLGDSLLPFERYFALRPVLAGF